MKAERSALTIMEVCGTHTSAIVKNGIHDLLGGGIRLVSGPGCPVCVTDTGFIDALIARAREGACVLSFGDLFRVRGTEYSFAEAAAEGASFRVIYSPFEAVELAAQDRKIEYIVAAVGFETTAPLYALLLETIIGEKIPNLRLCASLKSIVPAMDFICRREAVDGFICPGHVSAVIGADAYLPLLERYGKPLVVAGFEPAGILAAVREIENQAKTGKPAVVNLYGGAVTTSGNARARALIGRYFESRDGLWRGLGEIPDSALAPRAEYAEYFVEYSPAAQPLPAGCRCDDVLLGRISPRECALFGGMCRPENPVGACMVSHEGACGIWYGMNGGQL